ncbi:MAG: nuclear transport factor 2 family protein [Acidobacteria bacterium]|nr:nuclear transport factor 2 family protein [Acidobacteriota bacterium]
MNNRQIVESLYNAFASGDIPGLLGSFADNIEWTEAEGFPYGGTYVGAGAIVENVFLKLGSEWEGYSAVPSQFVSDGDTVVALGRYSGKYCATGRSMSVPFAHVWTLRDGKIARFVQYTDTLKVAEAL